MSAVQVLLIVAGVGGIVGITLAVEKMFWTLLETMERDDGEGEQ